ncbi:efflux RND transporter permease subunit [Oceanospirillum sediminis]|uniref:Efflux RND transporter permease subunit n=1 Tax=Oceanospirillum sediminis TaxID=2760088 RepID=A0A839ING8_9GAMM|nr:efflux RND transporter permease subunit [Oceanospirillum sediminis]MBB1486775.1 efflux RND transporter permease subunit [Oceanospirillum sediminis]
MIAWFTRNHVAANLLMIAIFITGIFSLNTKVPLEVFPSIEFDVVNITVTMRGASPGDMEQGVAVVIEQAIDDLEGIERIVNRSVEGRVNFYVDVDSDYDAKELLSDIKNRVDGISNLPVAADRPVISLAKRRSEVIAVTVAGDISEAEIRQVAEKVRDDLLQLPEVSQVELDGVRNYEVAIEISQQKLKEYGLTLSRVADIIASDSADLSAGNLKTRGNDVLLISRGQAYSQTDFGNIAIKSSESAGVLYLKDIATIHDGFEETALRTRFDGKPAAMIDVYRIGQESAISVADAVKEYLEQQQGQMPEGIQLSYWDDDSEVVKKRLNTLLENAAQGGVLVLALLALFLRPAIAFWVFIGIPVSFMGAFIVLPFLGISLNIISLFGFILVLGIVVDDAIVTGENIYRHARNGSSGLHAAIHGTQEVAVPVTFGVLTTIVAFLPLAFIEGHRGAMFLQIPAVVIPVLLLSLVESKFVLPAHLKNMRLRSDRKSGVFERFQTRFADGFESAILKYYRPILKLALKYRYTVLAGAIGLMVILVSLLSTGWMKFTFFPKVPSETARVTLTMPAGTAFEVTDRYVLHITEQARKLQEKYSDSKTGSSVIRHIFSTTGGAGGSSETGRVRFEITPAEERTTDITTVQLVREWRSLIGDIPGAESIAFRAEIGRSSDPVDIQLSGNDLHQLEQVTGLVREKLSTYPGLFDVADNLSDGKEELRIELKEQAYQLGLSRDTLVRQIQQAYLGIEVERIQRGREEIKVILRLPYEERTSLTALLDMEITGTEGKGIPLHHLAVLKPAKSPSAIYRIDGSRTVNVTSDMNKEAVNVTLMNQELSEFLQNTTRQFPAVDYSFEGEAKEQRDSFGSLQLGLMLVLATIYALLAIPFGSYVQPLIVMSVIPFGAIGAVVGHWIMGMPLTIMSLMGLLALVGVVVNDSLVLVDFINQQRRKAGYSLYKALLIAAPSRFRPVMLTSMTTFIGLMPLLFEKSTQAQFLIPMAVSLGFGILFATFITLILVPVNYLILEDLKNPGWKNKHISGVANELGE